MDYNKLSKIVSHALRHEPWLYELEPDQDGWVEIDQLIQSLQAEKEWADLDAADFSRMINVSDKKRHIISGSRIKALYGHSLPGKVTYESEVPPDTLFHGTSPLFLSRVLEAGLLPMKRQYVHLSVDYAGAELVGKRKNSKPVILEILAADANKKGVLFYKGNDKVWLADNIPANYLRVIKSH